MTMKYIIAAVLITPLLTVSSMAQYAPGIDQHVYQGGPKSSVPHAARQITGPGEAYASEAYAWVPRAVTSHRYRGGPQTVVPHSY